MKRKFTCILMAIVAVFGCLTGCGEKGFEKRVVAPEPETGKIRRVIYGFTRYGEENDGSFLIVEGRLRVEQVSETDYEIYFPVGTDFNFDTNSTEVVYNVVYIHINPGDFFCITAPSTSTELNTNEYYYRIYKTWYVGNGRVY